MGIGAVKIRIGLVGLALLLLVALRVAVPYGQEKFADDQVLSCDIDNNGMREDYVLKNYRLQAVEGNHLIWHSPVDWQVKQVKLADADNDGRIELVMIVWKKGSFGNSRPWWVKKQDDQQLSCHLFMYRIAAGRMKAVWCSSALEYPIKQIDILDVNGDRLNELKVQEIPGYGPFNRLRLWISGSHKSQWTWNGWGFERIMP